MAIGSLAQETIDSAFEALGEAADYRALVAGILQAPVSVLLIPTARDSIERTWEQARVRPEASFDVRKTEIAAPTKGGTLQFTTGPLLGLTFKIVSEPHKDDRIGLIWTMGSMKVTT